MALPDAVEWGYMRRDGIRFGMGMGMGIEM